MQVTQLRNATVIVHIGNRHILVDPMLAPQGPFHRCACSTGSACATPP